MSPTKAAKPTEVPFLVWICVGPRNSSVTGGARIPAEEGVILGRTIVNYI